MGRQISILSPMQDTQLTSISAVRPLIADADERKRCILYQELPIHVHWLSV